MKILLVSSFLPYPLFSGGHVRLYNIIKELSKKHEITLVCEKRPHQTNDDIIELKKICKKIFTVPRKKQWSLSSILKTGFSSDPFLIVGHTSFEMKQILTRLLKEEVFDVIHAETFYIMQNIPETTVPIVLIEHNIEYLVYERFVKTVSPVFRPLLTIDILKLKNKEKSFWKKADLLVAVSEEEKMIMDKKEVIVVPNGVDLDKFKIQKIKNKNREMRVLFIGDFKWIQNKTAVKRLVTEIWPLFRTKIKSEKLSVVLWIVGRNIPNSIKTLTDSSDILFDENAPKETLEIFQKADILISPVEVGGGTSFKVLEAMASGIPVITTPLGIEGIEAQANVDFLLADTNEEFVENLSRLCKDSEMYEKMSMNGRIIIEQNYDWKKIVVELENAYKSVIK